MKVKSSEGDTFQCLFFPTKFNSYFWERNSFNIIYVALRYVRRIGGGMGMKENHPKVIPLRPNVRWGVENVPKKKKWEIQKLINYLTFMRQGVAGELIPNREGLQHDFGKFIKDELKKIRITFTGKNLENFLAMPSIVLFILWGLWVCCFPNI